MYVQLSCTCIVRLRLGYCVHPRENDLSLSLRFLMDNIRINYFLNFLAVNFSVDKPEKLSTERLTARQREMLMKAKLSRATRLLIMKLTTNTV